MDSGTEDSGDDDGRGVLPTTTPQHVKLAAKASAGSSFAASPVAKPPVTTPATVTNARNFASGSNTVPVYK